jgi:hypothetical protein
MITLRTSYGTTWKNNENVVFNERQGKNSPMAFETLHASLLCASNELR